MLQKLAKFHYQAVFASQVIQLKRNIARKSCKLSDESLNPKKY